MTEMPREIYIGVDGRWYDSIRPFSSSYRGHRFIRADLAEKPAPDDKPDQFCKACEGYGVVSTTKSDLDGNYIEQECPVCFPAAPDYAEVREAIDYFYNLVDKGYLTSKGIAEHIQILIRAAEEATALQHILNESIKNCDELCDEVNKLRAAQSQNKNGEKE